MLEKQLDFCRVLTKGLPTVKFLDKNWLHTVTFIDNKVDDRPDLELVLGYLGMTGLPGSWAWGRTCLSAGSAKRGLRGTGAFSGAG